MSNRAEAERLAKRPYWQVAFRDELSDGGYCYIGVNPQLPGCMTQTDTLAEIDSLLLEARMDYIEFLLDDGLPVPGPDAEIDAGERATLQRYTFDFGG